MPFCCLLAAADAVWSGRRRWRWSWSWSWCWCWSWSWSSGCLELLVVRSCAIYETALHWPRPDFWDTFGFGWLSQRRQLRQLRVAAASVRLICDRLCVVSLRHGAWNLWHLTVNERAARPRITAVGAPLLGPLPLSPFITTRPQPLAIKLERWCRGSSCQLAKVFGSFAIYFTGEWA